MKQENIAVPQLFCCRLTIMLKWTQQFKILRDEMHPRLDFSAEGNWNSLETCCRLWWKCYDKTLSWFVSLRKEFHYWERNKHHSLVSDEMLQKVENIMVARLLSLEFSTTKESLITFLLLKWSTKNKNQPNLHETYYNVCYGKTC